MVFSSSVFLFLFLPAVLACYYVLRGRVARNVLLLLASLFFYAWGETAFVLVMCGSIAGNYLFGLLVDRYRGSRIGSRILIPGMLMFNLGILFVFKYLGFASKILTTLAGERLSVPEIALPIGISFFTFQAISYVIDVFRGRVSVQKNLLHVALYISFFPQLVAGPIVRYNTIADQITGRRENTKDFSYGCCRFLIGLAKKVLIANSIAVLADGAFTLTGTGELTVLLAWLGAVAYAFQIFFDFSGYSDMAIGLGRMFGFRFEENFNYPYVARTITEFWRRWHISLSMWFRDYVYFPLGGARVGSRWRLIFNLFIVWLLTGFWHGASWNFPAWGFMYFVFIALEKLIGMRTPQKDIMKSVAALRPAPRVLLHLYTLFVVLMGWVLFRAEGLRNAGSYLCSMFGADGNGVVSDYSILMLSENIVLMAIAAVCSTPVIRVLYRKLNAVSHGGKAVAVLVLMLLFVFSVSNIIKGSYDPFIYFRF